MAEFARAGQVRCFYCGAGSPWYECECEAARLIREGKKAKPKVISGLRGGPLIFAYDPDIRFLPMMRGAAAGQFMAPAVDKMLENTGFVDKVDSVDAESAPKLGPVDARKAYKREWMRRQRQRRK